MLCMQVLDDTRYRKVTPRYMQQISPKYEIVDSLVKEPPERVVAYQEESLMVDTGKKVKEKDAINKDYILSYDMYEDEYDDTYDDNVKGIEAVTVDELMHEMMKDASVFERSARKSKEREKLLKQTGMTHEQVEGWYKMVDKNDININRNPQQKSKETPEKEEKEQKPGTSEKEATKDDEKRKRFWKEKKSVHNRKNAHARKYK